MDCYPRVPSNCIFDNKLQVKSGNCIAGRRERTGRFPFLKHGPRSGIIPSAKVPFGPKNAIWIQNADLGRSSGDLSRSVGGEAPAAI